MPLQMTLQEVIGIIGAIGLGIGIIVVIGLGIRGVCADGVRMLEPARMTR